MLTTIKAAKCIGIDAIPIIIEINIDYGIGVHLVGLGDIAVKESLLRITTALSSLGFEMPGCKIVINLAPADTQKHGSCYDLPIAIGILSASTFLAKNKGKYEFPHLGDYLIMGELGLDGSIREVVGALPIASLAKDLGLKGCILPYKNALETVGFGFGEVYGVRTVQDVIAIVSGYRDIAEPLLASNLANQIEKCPAPKTDDSVMDFSEIIGQEQAKRGMEIAASGGHNVLLIGSPGSGKSSLAKAMSRILPPLTSDECLQTSKIYSVAGKNQSIITARPFRSPHYSISMPALIGGGSDVIAPGEISLAHNGVLFVDEFCEAPKKIIDSLRAPMEDGCVTISRLKNKITYPSDFMLVAATNPCPCGYYKEGDKCTCTAGKRLAYLSKLSGPILDRIDIHLWLKRVDTKALMNKPQAESTAIVLERVMRAREIQKDRFKPYGITTNSQMNSRLMDEFCHLDAECSAFFENAIEKHSLSARSYAKILKIARTIADMDGAHDIALSHIFEAVNYRILDSI